MGGGGQRRARANKVSVSSMSPAPASLLKCNKTYEQSRVPSLLASASDLGSSSAASRPGAEDAESWQALRGVFHCQLRRFSAPVPGEG